MNPPLPNTHHNNIIFNIQKNITVLLFMIKNNKAINCWHRPNENSPPTYRNVCTLFIKR